MDASEMDASAMEGQGMTDYSPPAEEQVVVGRVLRAHGIKGGLVVEPLTGAPHEVFVEGRRLSAGTTTGELGRSPLEVCIEWAEPFQRGFRVKFVEVADRTQAELWRGRYLFAPAADVPPPDEGEVDPAEVLGFTVERSDGTVIGTVESFYDLPQGILLEVSRPSGPVLLPLNEEFLHEVDVGRRVLVIDPPDGLLE